MTENAPKPTIGRIVHFYTNNLMLQTKRGKAGPYAAMVVGFSPSDIVQLTVFPAANASTMFLGEVPDYVEEGEDTTALKSWWTWPPRSGT